MKDTESKLSESQFFKGFRSFTSPRLRPSDLNHTPEFIQGWECAKRNAQASESNELTRPLGSALSRLRPYGKHRE